jgi:hypothetical protein
MERRLEHFATRAAATTLLGLVEADRPLWFALMGSFNSPDTPVYQGAGAIPDLGVARRNSTGVCDRYLVYDRDVPIVRREVTSQKRWRALPCRPLGKTRPA